MQAPDAGLPINLMNVFFRQGNAVLVEGPYVFSDSVKLDRFSVREVSDYSPEKRQMEILTRNALEGYFSGNESFSFQDIQRWIANPSCGLPGLHRDAVMGLLKI